jgi:protein involved in polysaccharide export with SLBB domain
MLTRFKKSGSTVLLALRGWAKGRALRSSFFASLVFSAALAFGQTDSSRFSPILPGPAPGKSIAKAPAPALNTNASYAAPVSTNAGSSLPSNLSGYVPDDKYKLRVGDRVAFQIIEDRDAPKSLVVADSGELDIPYIGRVMATDKTCKQLSSECKTLLEKEYYFRATVVIALDAANRLLGRIYVWGQVKTQGPIDIAVNENLTVGKAILRAGGFGDFANKKRVKVVRAAAEGANKQTFELNMVDILEDGKTEKDVMLQPEDSIIVPTRLINF